MNPPVHPAALSLTKRLLLLLPPLLFAGLWWATAEWGAPQVEREIERELTRDHPEAARVIDGQYHGTETGPPIQTAGSEYYLKVHSPFPLLLRCEYHHGCS